MPTLFSTRFVLALTIVLSLVACGKSTKPVSQRKKKDAEDDKYSFGQIVGFGWEGNSTRYKRGGWGETEENFTWTTAGSARLIFTVPESDQPLRLRIRLAGFTVPPAIPFQPVRVLANDEEVAIWQVTSEMVDYIAIIPPDVADHEQLIVELRMPRAASPKMLEVGDDSRTLGVSCSELSINETTSTVAAAERLQNPETPLIGNEYAFGTVINFGAGAGSQRYKKFGWHIADDRYTWIGKQRATLELTIPPTVCLLSLKMKLSAMMKPRELPAQPTDVYINGDYVAQWDVRGWEIFEAFVPSDIARRGGTIKIELEAPRAVSPSTWESGADKRILGVRCEAMVISEEEEITEVKATPTPSRKVRARKRQGR